MTHPVISRLRSQARLIKRRIVSSGVILMYHRVATPGADPWELAVSPETFDQQIQMLKAHGVRLMTAAEIAAAVAENRVPRLCAAITFDDGYLDNLTNARPILERHDAPATVFVPAGMVGMGEPFWWDRLAAAIFRPERLPERLRVGQQDWATSGDRTRLYFSVWQHLVDQEPEVQEQSLTLIEAGAGKSGGNHDEPRIVDEQELRRLQDGGLVEIGSHGWSHRRLGELPPAEQHREIERSRIRLEEMLGKPVTGLAYPHGSQSRNTPKLARECGYAYACGTYPGPVWNGAKRFHLPRLVVNECTPEAFERFIADRLLS